MQIWAGSGKSALPICNYSQILYQFLTFTQNLKRSQILKGLKPGLNFCHFKLEAILLFSCFFNHIYACLYDKFRKKYYY